MKRVLLPIMTVAVASASILFTACSSTDPSEEIAAALAEVKDIQEGGQKYKTHEKQKDKFVLPNASLETSRALYLPIGGALSDMVNESFGNSYVRENLLGQTKGDTYTRIWSQLKKNYTDTWFSQSKANRDKRIEKWEKAKLTAPDMTEDKLDAAIKNYSDDEKAMAKFYIAELAMIANLDPDNQDADKAKSGDSKKKKPSFLRSTDEIKKARLALKDQVKNADTMLVSDLELELINQLVLVNRKSDAEEFTSLSDKDKKAQLKKIDENDTEKWFEINEATLVSAVHTKNLAAKEAIEKKISAEKAKSWDEVIEADRKVAAFTGYWCAMIGKRLYPIVIPLVPIPDPVQSILTASTPVADKALGKLTDELAKTDEWLPSSLNLEVSKFPALKKAFGDNASMDDILGKLGDEAFVNTLFDMDLIAKIKDPKGYVSKTISNPFELPKAIAELKETTSKILVPLQESIQKDLDDEDYGMVPLHAIQYLGSDIGKEFIQALNAELDPYRYANDVALKRMEYTTKAMEWLSGDSIEKVFQTISNP